MAILFHIQIKSKFRRGGTTPGQAPRPWQKRNSAGAPARQPPVKSSLSSRGGVDVVQETTSWRLKTKRSSAQENQ